MSVLLRSYFSFNKFGHQFLRYSSEISKDIQKDLDLIVKKNKVVVFMKGVPSEPRCGFSNAVVQILRMHAVEYDAHDVLKDENIRNGKFCYNNW